MNIIYLLKILLEGSFDYRYCFLTLNILLFQLQLKRPLLVIGSIAKFYEDFGLNERRQPVF